MFELNSKKFRQLLFERGKSLSSFAKENHLHNKTIQRCLQDGERARLETIKKLADALNVNPETLLIERSVA